MTDQGDVVPQDLINGEDESNVESSDATDCLEVTEIVLKPSVLAAMAYLQEISRNISDCSFCCDRLQGMSFLSRDQSQVLRTTVCPCDACIQVVLSSRSNIELLSRGVAVSIQSLPSNRTNRLPGIVLQAIDVLTHTSQDIIKIFSGQIYQTVLDKEIYQELKQLGMIVFRCFSHLAEHVYTICKDTHTRIVIDITILARHLAQKGLNRILPSTVWSLCVIKDLLPDYISHHEALCERFYLAGEMVEFMWHLVWEVFRTDVNMVSEKIVKMLIYILLKHESIFSADRIRQLDQVMAELLHLPMFDDVLALGILLYWETYETTHTENVIETLIRKARHLFEIWMHWFHSVGRQLLDVEGTSRADVSLRFLRRFAELAIANFQNFLAVKSLCEAYSLAHKMKKLDVVKDVTQIIISLMPQLGLHMGHDDPENTDLFMDSAGLGEDSGLLGLVAIASHHLNTGQLQKFQHVRDAFFTKILSWPLTDDDKIIIEFSQAVMKRLEAEFCLLPGSRQMCKRDDCTESLPHALCLALSAFELIEVMCTKESKFCFPKDKALYNILGSWQIVHEYLCATKLTGELFSHTGDVETGETYFKKGLQAAETLKLATWATIFHSKLVENALVHHDLKDATEKLQNAQSFIECSISTLKPCLQHRHGNPTIYIEPNVKLPHGLQVTYSEGDQISCSCQKKSYVRQDMISDLLEGVILRKFENSKGPMLFCLILPHISGSCNCQSEIITSCINIICFQAEILWRKERSICLLQCSVLMADMFSKIPLCTNIMELFNSIGLKVSYLSQTKSSDRIVAETRYRCAEIYFQNLYFRSADSNLYSNIENIISLLETAEKVGQRVRGYGMCNVVASALLLKNSTHYLSILKTESSEDVTSLETSSDSLTPVFDIITSTLQLLSLKEDVCESKQAGDNKQQSDDNKKSKGESKQQTENNAQQLDDSEKTVSRTNQQSSINLSEHRCTETVSQEEKPACADSISEVPASVSGSDSTVNSLRWKILIENFPSLVAYQKVTRRKRCLQRALREICEFPHYLLYRQISQALALCLWEKQMVDAWETNQACSTQLEIAAHLTDSMHVTFQHKMYFEYCYRLSKYFWKILKPDKGKAMEEAMQVFRFGGDVMENFKNRQASLPTGWTVVQMTIANFDPSNPDRGQIFVTRINHEQEPITIGLPSQRNKFLGYAKKAYLIASIPSGQMESMPDVLKYLQEVFLAGHKWLLRGQLDCVGHQSVHTYLDNAGRRAVDSILQQHGYLICYTELRSLLEVLLEATEADILSLVECMWPPHVAGTVTQICMDVQREVVKMCVGQLQEKRGPVILILDNELICFPWESIPDLILDTVTRMPSLANLIAHLTLHTKLSRSPFKGGVDRSSVVGHIHLQSDGGLVKELRKYQGWHISTERVNASLFRKSSLFINIGDDRMGYGTLQKSFGKAFAVIINYGSGSLTSDRKVDAKGIPLYFLKAGCVAMMGNLWMTPPNDFNETISHLISSWMSQSQHVSIKELMVAARQECESPGFSAAGLVIYGLPVMMN